MMNKLTTAALVMTVALFAPFAGAEKAASKVNLSTEKARLGYTIGVQMVQRLANGGMLDEVDLTALKAAFDDVANGTALQMTADQMQATQEAFSEKKKKEFEAMAEKNKANGAAFVAENKKDKNLKTTPSGLMYQVMREGNWQETCAGRYRQNSLSWCAD